MKQATLYGIATCDTCRKAKKTLENEGVEVTFHDVRESPLTQAALNRFFSEFGDQLVNTRSTTWRGLSVKERELQPVVLMLDHPTLMKRPVIESAGGLTVGWNASVQALHCG